MTRRQPSSRPRRPRSANARHQATGRLRIIGGEYRRRLLPVIDSPGLRPTPDRVRETLFNWLQAATSGARVLDLYAGTGALGLEALSRGASEAVFIERAPDVAAALEANLATLGANGQVERLDAMHYLTHATATFDVVFVDPPFRQGLTTPACHTLESRGWLSDDAWIYVETEQELPPEVPRSWQLHREVHAGDSSGRLYRRKPSPPGDAC
ncbi:MULTISPECIES: 16S rRNA (guanine(966)-N(2))-methyltransferase RsmD [Halomonadaceae]|uniref:16S rRNA (guanine(966)-N(2))-methyltransferase RsmD n=1 Tax=Halomonadaceae TaxID=28256 RepID=UPI001597DCD3|nr:MULTISPECIES: 16S rRNA (guanine(966)-N(2))-methyltransferase RsmD [Halomonas]QJQ94592.1 16S rRNA (guanine(966)-N(2))-methyltransferase RsmD [Halomonas sp. PA5]